jgi:hypothetical protein
MDDPTLPKRPEALVQLCHRHRAFPHGDFVIAMMAFAAIPVSMVCHKQKDRAFDLVGVELCGQRCHVLFKDFVRCLV